MDFSYAGFFLFSVEILMKSNECCPKKLTDRDLMKLAQEHSSLSFMVLYIYLLG